MAEASRNTLKDEILRVLRNSEDMLRTFKSQIENKNVIIFIGNTRNGKSTLFNYITEAPLVAFQDGDSFKIRHLESNTGPTIGHGTLSHTTIPTIIEMKSRPNTIIIDAPGFDDNRGPLQEITNALYINQIKYSRSVQFVLVSDINNIINDNINYFLNFIETVHTIMPNFAKLKDAVSIIFTKDSKNYEMVDIVKLLKKKILEVDALRCKKDLIKHFVERENLIGLFKMPSSVGALTEEINVNVHGAIFNYNVPVNLQETDIKFGISTSARIVLLETYMEFFDVVHWLAKTFLVFRTSAYEKFAGLHKKNLVGLHVAQIQGEGKVEQIMCQLQNRVKKEYEELASATQIPQSLKQLFIEEVNRATILIQRIGVQALSSPDPMYNSNTVQEVCKKLEYIICIEEVVEINTKSLNILSEYKQSLEKFYKQIEKIRDEIRGELDYRDVLVEQIQFSHQMQRRLEEINEAYLSASFHDELVKMKAQLEQYLTLSDFILNAIILRPPLQQNLTQEISFASSIQREIRVMLGNINQHIENRNREDWFKKFPPCITGLTGTVLLYEGVSYIMTLGRCAQFAAFSSSFFLFAAVSWKCTYMRNFYSRIRRRYQQKRLLTRSTKLDDCCKEMEGRLYHR